MSLTNEKNALKIMFASDIHGSAFWCEKLMQAYEKERPDKLVLLGDLLYHGPRNNLPDGYAPKEVAAMLNSVKTHLLCVRGNCDAEVDAMVLDFPIGADYAMLFLFGRTIFVTHGHLAGENNLPPLASGDLILNGHTHVPCRKLLDGGITYLNCGSIALPKENTPHSFLIAENGELLWKDLSSYQVFDRMQL